MKQLHLQYEREFFILLSNCGSCHIVRYTLCFSNEANKYSEGKNLNNSQQTVDIYLFVFNASSS